MIELLGNRLFWVSFIVGGLIGWLVKVATGEADEWGYRVGFADGVAERDEHGNVISLDSETEVTNPENPGLEKTA